MKRFFITKKWIILSCLVGLLSGLVSSLFLYTLSWATETRTNNLVLVNYLPIAGFIIGCLFYRFGKKMDNASGLILEEIHTPKNIIPLTLAPLVFSGTILTHLFGGSAGREGTAVQMGASIADQINKYFKMSNEERKILILAGTSAGFSAAIGTPWAGVVFGFEMIQVGQIKFFGLIECIVASLIGFFISKLTNAPHSIFGKVTEIDFSLKYIAVVVVCAIIFGLAARIFIRLTHRIENFNKQYIKFPPLRPMFAGFILLILYHIEGTFRYIGLGIEIIQRSFFFPASINEGILKLFYTAITVGSGFKGGEFIPLVFIGTTLGSYLAGLFSVSVSLLSAVGFISVFAAAANTPITGTILAIELFGWKTGVFAFISCWIAFYFSGNNSIYKNQKFYYTKVLHFQKIILFIKMRINKIFKVQL